MEDCLSRALHAGDIVTYPVRRGSVLSLEIAQVTSVDNDYLEVLKLDNGPGRHTRVQDLTRVTLAVRASDVSAALSAAFGVAQ